MTLEELKNDYDWQEVFKYAGENEIDDVEEVIASEDGCNDGEDWIGIFRMKNGKFLHVWAWCDYTGWGCQEGGDYAEYNTLEEALSKMALPQDNRDRLKGQLSKYKLDW